MISAKDAKSLADDMWSSMRILQSIEDKITEAAKNGKYSIFLDYEIMDHMTEDVWKCLENLGYKFRTKVDSDNTYTGGVVKLCWD